MTDRLLAASLLWFVVWLILLLLRRQSPLHPLILAAISCGLIGSFFPVASCFVEPLTWRNLAALSDRVYLDVQRDYVAFAAGLLVAAGIAWRCGWLRSARRTKDVPLPPYARHRDAWVTAGLFISGALLYAMWVSRVGLAAITTHEDYAEKYLLSHGLGAFRYGLRMMIAACLWAEVAPLSKRAKIFYRIAAAGICVWTIGFMSVRGNLVILAVGYVYIFCSVWRIELRRIRPLVVVAGLVLVVGLECFGRVRGQLDEGFRVALGTLVEQLDVTVARVVGGSELSHAFITTLEVEASKEGGALAGASYWNALLIAPPMAIVPTRPETLSVGFAKEFYPRFAEAGGGTNFSIVAEAWWNFGAIVGPFLVALVLGLVLCRLEQEGRVRPHGVVARAIPFLLFFVIILQGSESAILVKQILSLSAVVLAWSFVAHAVWRARRATGPKRLQTALPGALGIGK